MIRKVIFPILLSVFFFLPKITWAQDIPSSIFGNYEGEVQITSPLLGIDETLPGITVALKRTDTENDYVLQLDLPFFDFIAMDNVDITPFEDGYNLSKTESINFIIPEIYIPPIPIFLPDGGVFYDIPAVITLENSNIVDYVLNLNLKLAITINIGIPLSIPFNVKFEGAHSSLPVINTMRIMQLNVYPNPVSNILHIETGNINTIPEIKIYSIQGILLINTIGNEIDVSALPIGIYIAEINGERKKVVKQ